MKIELNDVDIDETVSEEYINHMSSVMNQLDSDHSILDKVYTRDNKLTIVVKGEPWDEEIYLKDGEDEHFLCLNNKMLVEYLHNLPSKNYEFI